MASVMFRVTGERTIVAIRPLCKVVLMVDIFIEFHAPAPPCCHIRTSIASYRAEATFFKTFAGSKVLSGIAPHAFWVHVDDRLGEEKEETGIAAVGGCGGGGGRLKDEEEVVKALRESCFMMITGGWVVG